MKAIVQEGYGAPERVLKLEEIDRPSVGDGDVLIRVRATSVNTPDWITVTGVPYLLRLKSGLRRPSTPVRGNRCRRGRGGRRQERGRPRAR
jgi:NADPH:quinone reductase-like Zn-dependent oxidoreductase